MKKISNYSEDAITPLHILQLILDEWIGPKAPWSTLKGKKVLELASGTETSGYPPWFSRLYTVFDAEVIAIDVMHLGEEDRKMFTCVQADLIEIVMGDGLGSIPELKNKKFDLIHSSRFIGFNPPLEVVKELNRRGVTLDEFEMKLTDQAEKLLAPKGYIDVTDVWAES
ncbi:MAG: hypothetical protein WC894_04835 [Patescibacteria group bacterium]